MMCIKAGDEAGRRTTDGRRDRKKSSYTIKGGSRRAKKSRKELMIMMKAAKLGWVGPGAGQELGRSRPGEK